MPLYLADVPVYGPFWRSWRTVGLPFWIGAEKSRQRRSPESIEINAEDGEAGGMRNAVGLHRELPEIDPECCACCHGRRSSMPATMHPRCAGAGSIAQMHADRRRLLPVVIAPVHHPQCCAPMRRVTNSSMSSSISSSAKPIISPSSLASDPFAELPGSSLAPLIKVFPQGRGEGDRNPAHRCPSRREPRHHGGGLLDPELGQAQPFLWRVQSDCTTEGGTSSWM